MFREGEVVGEVVASLVFSYLFTLKWVSFKTNKRFDSQNCNVNTPLLLRLIETKVEFYTF